MNLGLSRRYFPEVCLRSEVESSRWEVTSSICCEINELAERNNISALFVLLPGAYQVDETIAHGYARALHIDLDTIDLDQPPRLVKKHLSSRARKADERSELVVDHEVKRRLRALGYYD